MAMPQLKPIPQPPSVFYQLQIPEQNSKYKDARERHLARFAYPLPPQGCTVAERIAWEESTPRGKEAARIHPSNAQILGNITLDEFFAKEYVLAKPITFQVEKIPSCELYRANVAAWRNTPASWVYTFSRRWEDHPVLAVEATMNDMLDCWRELEELRREQRLGWPRDEEHKWLSRYFTIERTMDRTSHRETEHKLRRIR
jgi:hypothetical protein